jgi:hypothetical protein
LPHGFVPLRRHSQDGSLFEVRIPFLDIEASVKAQQRWAARTVKYKVHFKWRYQPSYFQSHTLNPSSMSSDTDAHRSDAVLQLQASEELSLLGDDPASGLDLSDTDHSLRTAPILTGDALRAVGCGVFPQRASYGRIISQHVEGFASATQSPSLYINTNAPFSALVCGVQVRHQPYFQNV